MADFVKVEGVTLPLRVGSFTDAREYLGVSRRSTSGQLFDVINSEHMAAEGTIRPVDQATGKALRRYLNGDGESWLFDAASVYGSRGSAPNAGGSYTAYSTGGVFNLGRVNVASGNYIELPGDFSGDWTIDLWKYETIANEGAASDAFYRYTVRGNATTVTTTEQIRNAVSGSHNAASWITVPTTSAVRIYGKAGYVSGGGASVARNYSMITLRAYHVTSAMAVAMHGFNAQLIAGLPHLFVDGEAIDDGPIECVCRARSVTHHARGIIDVGWDKSAREIAVSIRERG